MATPAQIKSNRNNAKKSTGPRTEEGKTRSAQNSASCPTNNASAQQAASPYGAGNQHSRQVKASDSFVAHALSVPRRDSSRRLGTVQPQTTKRTQSRRTPLESGRYNGPVMGNPTNNSRRLRFVLGTLALFVSCSSPESRERQAEQPAPPPALTQAQLDTIDEVTGVRGTFFPEEGVHKVTFPRTDVAVQVDGQDFDPFLGLTSWASFTPLEAGGLMVMGDLTLFEDEVNPVMSVALDHGLEVTALHNHFFYDRPKVMFMHIGGRGSAEALAAAVARAIAKVAEIRGISTPAVGFLGTAIPDEDSITPERIDSVLGLKGATKEGMYKAVIGRRATMHGREVGKQMGVNTWAAFSGSDESASVDGDFAVLESELQGVLRALRRADINIVAIHNHMVYDQPRYIFLHYWGRGSSVELSRGIRAALDGLGSG